MHAFTALNQMQLMLLPLINEWVEMENRTKSQGTVGGIKAFLGKREKKCSKCGFVTFCLHVLYNHKYKCRGQLLGHPISCTYCHRKFHFFVLYKAHKITCVRKRKVKLKLLKSKIKKKTIDKRAVKKSKISDYSLSCPICGAVFQSKLKFVSHLKMQKCTSNSGTKKGLSARKTLNHKYSKNKHSYVNKNLEMKENYCSITNNDVHFSCLWCKSSYPSKKLLSMHLKTSEECSIYYDNQVARSKVSLKARKTINVVAKKSFSHTKRKASNHNKYSESRSARKSLGLKFKLKISNTDSSSKEQCPVCGKRFEDTFSFFQHQKVKNHWGKATKSFMSSYKCPFCTKEFIHLKSRNVHLQYHSDIDEQEIKAFISSITCNICFKSHASELAKHQHMRTKHNVIDKNETKPEFKIPDDYVSMQKMSSVPSSVKKKLKQQPNICPVCSKAFSHTVLRNKHFNEIHLKIFECQFCNTKFKSSSSLSNHIQLSHGKTLECPHCCMMFSNEIEILEHALHSHPDLDLKPFLNFKSKNSLSKEKSEDNPDISPEILNAPLGKNMEYYCDVCNLGFQKLCGLQSHRQSKFHKDTLVKNLDAVQKMLYDAPSPSPPLPRTIKQPEILTCSECCEDFTNIKEFVPHRMSHFSVQGKYLKITELNPYMCEICSDVLDSHSKVQMHLFWHLQIESTSNSNIDSYKTSGKGDKIVPDRLSGQHVARKSLSKQNNESFEEVVIGGVKKTLFTCESCNVGFTTKAHYNMHVKKLCKKKITNEFISGLTESLKDENLKNIVHCISCNCLFSSATKHEQHKEFCVKCTFDGNSSEIVSNLDAIKTALKIDIAMAGCVTCGAIFDDISVLSRHLNIHQPGANPVIADFFDDITHCSLCNCLFSLPVFKSHKDFCKTPLNLASKANYSKHMNVLKSGLELKCAVAGCMTCGSPFEDLEHFSRHLTLHQSNQITSQVLDSGLDVEHISTNAENEIDKSTNSCKSNVNDELSKSLPNRDLNTTEELRNNFSQLLCLLISDSELMQKLGYGEQLVDDVLVNVLQQMGQEPVSDNITPPEKFRKNIQIFLDFCLKDQIMQAIGNGKTTDEMVIEALKIFNTDDLNSEIVNPV